MNKAPRIEQETKKTLGRKTRIGLRVAAAVASLPLLAGCFDLGQAQPGDAAPNPIETSAPTGDILVNPGPHFQSEDSFTVPKSYHQPKTVEHLGDDVCPWTREQPNQAMSTDIGPYTRVPSIMLDKRCADFPGVEYGMPGENGTQDKHFIGYTEPNTNSHAVDLSQQLDIQDRGPYQSEYVAACTTPGELFRGTDGRYSRTWMLILGADGQRASESTFVPYAESYASGTDIDKIVSCNALRQQLQNQ